VQFGKSRDTKTLRQYLQAIIQTTATPNVNQLALKKKCN